MIVVPLRTTGSNAREDWRVRHGRVKRERQAVAWLLMTAQRPSIPCTVLLTRSAPSGGLDDDNLRAALKGASALPGPCASSSGRRPRARSSSCSASLCCRR